MFSIRKVSYQIGSVSDRFDRFDRFDGFDRFDRFDRSDRSVGPVAPVGSVSNRFWYRILQFLYLTGVSDDSIFDRFSIRSF